MKLLQSLLLAATCLAASSDAFLVERGMPDGIYIIGQDDVGTNTTSNNSTLGAQFYNDPRARARRKRDNVFYKTEDIALWKKPFWPIWEEYSVPLPVSSTKCFPDRGKLDQIDYRRAVARLKQYCHDFDVAPKGAYVSVSGAAMVYVCSIGGVNHCHKYEWDEAALVLDDKCGILRDGVIKMKKWNKKYGRGHTGTTVCEKLNKGQGRKWRVSMVPAWVEGMMYEQWLLHRGRERVE